MSVINIEKYLEKKEQMLNFIIQNEEKYSLEGTRVLAEELLEDIILIKQQYNIVDMRQILSKFEVYKENKDPYQLFAKLLKQYSFLSGNCCEVGAGSYPRVTELVAPIIKKNGGKLTVYEPDILFTDFNATFIKDKFTKKTDTSNIDTLFALYPCQATIAIAEKAFEEDKNLLLAFCSCNHSTPKYQKWIGKYWAEDVCMEFREKYGKEAQIINWPPEAELSTPILVRESSKQLKKHL